MVIPSSLTPFWFFFSLSSTSIYSAPQRIHNNPSISFPFRCGHYSLNCNILFEKNISNWKLFSISFSFNFFISQIWSPFFWLLFFIYLRWFIKFILFLRFHCTSFFFLSSLFIILFIVFFFYLDEFFRLVFFYILSFNIKLVEN
jgi:hypothetical protein